MYKGIDISAHQGDINLDKVCKNLDFVILRSSYGTHYEDAYFRRNIKKCKELNIPYGVYHYSYSLNVKEAKAEANFMLKLLKDVNYKPCFIAYDMEDADGYKKKNGIVNDNDLLVNMCNEFCKTTEKAGYYSLIYANLNWFKTKLNNSKLDRFDKWLAQWSAVPTYNKKFSIWQYTSSLNIYGYFSRLDGNILYDGALADIMFKEDIVLKGDEVIAEEVIAGKWGNGDERKEKLHNAGYDYDTIQSIVNKLCMDSEDNNTESVTEYTIASGDTLTSIATKFNTTVDKIAQDNNITDVNVIYAGEVLKIWK